MIDSISLNNSKRLKTQNSENIYTVLFYELFDIFFSFFALLLFSPIILVIAIVIKIKSPNGSIFFAHKRKGLRGKDIYVHKFRTMYSDADIRLDNLLNENPKLREEYNKNFKLKNDPRIIEGIGNFLRKTSLDELPQFFDSLCGNLSIVGPRPIVQDELKKYGQYAQKLLSVKPGITGLWQVSGRNNLSYEERVNLDMKYINKKTFFLDLKIIFLTVKVMILREGM